MSRSADRSGVTTAEVAREKDRRAIEDLLREVAKTHGEPLSPELVSTIEMGLDGAYAKAGKSGA